MEIPKVQNETFLRLEDMARTRDVVQNFFKDNERRYANNTVRQYTVALRQFFAYCKIEYDSVTTKDIRAWLAALDTAGQKMKTLCVKLITIKSFYRYCLEEELINESPASNVRLPKLADTELHYLERRTLARLMELTKNKPVERAMLATLYATGVRITELLNIRIGDINWETRQIVIRKGKGNKDRFVLFTAECAERLKDYLATFETPYLFARSEGKPWSAGWARSKFRGYTRELNSAHPITPHTMRHTFAAHLAEKNMPLEYIQELLGHVRLNTTQGYIKLSAHSNKKQYDDYQ